MEPTTKSERAPPNSEPRVLTASRHAELLRIARKSRMYWVLQARDQTSSANKEEKPTSIDRTHLIPAALAMQQVLDFLNRIVDDGNEIDLDSLLLTIDSNDEDEDGASEEEMLAQFKAQNQGLSSYELFLKKLLHPQAGPVVKSLQQFVGQFTARARDHRIKRMQEINIKQSEKDVEDLVKAWSGTIWKFLDPLFELMKGNPIWSGDTPAEFDKDKANAEKFVFVKLHPTMFAFDPEDAHINKETSERIASLAFISADHLDIKSLKHLPRVPATEFSAAKDPLVPLLATPVQHLYQLERARCPADMLICLRQCSASIAAILKDVRSDGTLPGADELLPMMILTLKLCNPSQIHSYIKYLQRYTRPEKLVSEAGYLLTNFVSAVYFLDNVNAQALTIEPDEFEQAIALSKRRAKQVVSAASKRTATASGDWTYRGEEAGMGGGGEESRVDCAALVAEYKAAIKTNKHKEFISLRDC